MSNVYFIDCFYIRIVFESEVGNRLIEILKVVILFFIHFAAVNWEIHPAVESLFTKYILVTNRYVKLSAYSSVCLIGTLYSSVFVSVL